MHAAWPDSAPNNSSSSASSNWSASAAVADMDNMIFMFIAGALTNASVNNTAADNASADAFYAPTATVVMATVGVFYSALGVAGNLLTVVALTRSRRLRKNHMTTFVIFLAVADLLFCGVSLPVNTTRYMLRRWALGGALCRVFPYFFYSNIASSILMMLLITVNRYVIIVHRAAYTRLYRRAVVVGMVLFAYAFPPLLLLPTLVGAWGRFGLNERTMSCTFLVADGRSARPFVFVLGVFVPTIVILVCYLRICFRVHRSNRDIEARIDGLTTTQLQQRQHCRDEHALTRTMISVFTAFFVCNIPVVFVALTLPEDRLPWLHLLASALTWTTAIVNPLIYAYNNDNYRHAYAELLCGRGSRWRRRRFAAQQTITCSISLSSRLSVRADGSRFKPSESLYVLRQACVHSLDDADDADSPLRNFAGHRSITSCMHTL
ncbi:PREDICTED: protein trapped in endoderm-1-like [Priapulus caudatus]|uniref:Protein trapped in endoderm-1-like n=1 Tax=Priapulus caudatus TaxID=37621 RepID=A0ABM1EEI6_PRICU|nr:PREDICTED: protein trapped in endoderm-1-like [Priapulus caudatus]